MKILDSFLNTVDYLFDHGEMMKAYIYLRNAPSIIDDEQEVLKRLSTIQTRLKTISNIQNYFSTDGKMVAKGPEPGNIEGLVKVQLLKKYIKQLRLKKLLDVGCHTGWLGRHLSVDGISVFGIDVHPLVIMKATLVSSGSLAKFGIITAQQIGYSHPKEFDGAVVFDVLEHLFDVENAIRSIERSVVEDGWVFMAIPHPKAEHKAGKVALHNKEHLSSFSERKLKELFGKKKSYDLQEVINEGDMPMWFLKYQV